MRGENFGCDDPYRLASGRKSKAKIWIPREGQRKSSINGEDGFKWTKTSPGAKSPGIFLSNHTSHNIFHLN